MEGRPETERVPPGRILGRYALFGEIARGGMATVHVGRLLGPVGFARTVAIKRMRPHSAESVSMFVDEARICARIQHPNVVATLDVVTADDELFLVFEYIHGDSLSHVWRKLAARGERIPPRIAAAIAVGLLRGLHAAHEATDEQGVLLNVIHRDVSPHNVLIGADGIARVLDFGVAKAVGRLTNTRGVELKGKLAYMAPEQYLNRPLSRTADVFAASVVFWEALTGKRLYETDSEASTVHAILHGTVAPPSKEAPDLPAGLDEIVLRGLAHAPEHRYQTAREMALAIETCTDLASMTELGEWLQEVAKESLQTRAKMIAAVESVRDVTSLTPARDDPEPGGKRILPGDATSSATIRLGVSSPSLPRLRRRFPLWGLVAMGTMVVAVAAAALLRVSPPAETAPVSASTVAASAAVAPPAESSADTEAAALSASSAPVPHPAPKASAPPVKSARQPAPRPTPTALHGLPPGLPDQRE